MIPKKIHYVWFWKWEKPKNFEKIFDSWKKFCPDYEIIEWNEENFDVSENYYCKKFYDKWLYAFASDYARMKILYDNWGIYLDVDMEILKNLDNLLENKAFTGFENKFSVWWAIIWSEKNNKILKEILDFYKNKKTRIILPNLLNKIFKKYWLEKYNNKNQKIWDFIVYTKEYFYPYAYFEKESDKIITKNTYAIHHYKASWLPKIVTKIFFPIIWFFNKKLWKKN